MNDDFEGFDPRFYTKWERTLVEDHELHQLLSNNSDRRAVQEHLNKREWFNRVGANLPTDMLLELATSKPYFAQLVLENNEATANLSAKDIKVIHNYYLYQFNKGKISIEQYGAIEKSQLNNPHFATTILQDSDMINRISKQNFLHMFDKHKNNVDFCRELIANKDKLPERLSLKELQKDERFRKIVKASPHIPQDLGKSSVLQKMNVIDRMSRSQDTGYEPPRRYK